MNEEIISMYNFLYAQVRVLFTSFDQAFKG